MGDTSKTIAAYFASLFANLPAEAFANVNSNHSSMTKCNHIGDTTSSARAIALKKRFLEEEAGLVQSIAGICARVVKRTMHQYAKMWLANEGFFNPLN